MQRCSHTTCKTDKLLTAGLCRPISIPLRRHKTLLFQHGGKRLDVGMPLLMWQQSVGPFTPAVVADHHEIRNICHFLTLSCATNVLLTRRLLAKRTSSTAAGSWKWRMPPWSWGCDCGLSRVPEAPLTLLCHHRHGSICCSLIKLELKNCPVQWGKSS